MPLVPSPAVTRAGDLLAHLAAHPTRAFSVSELARRLDMPRATCASVLLGLVVRGFVRRDAELRYELGPACIVVGDAARAANPALRAAAVHGEALARAQSSVVAVTMRDGDETRVAHVFDFGPPFGLRPRAGDAIALVPPFGASFVAWDDEASIQSWLERAQPPLSPAEVARYLAALDAVRRRGYSVTVADDRQRDLAPALEKLLGGPDADDARRMRDDAIRQITHSEYLAADLDAEGTVRLIQVSAPVFQLAGEVAASVMLLGPGHDVSAAQIAVLGSLVVTAAARAMSDIGDGRGGCG
jgi:DNA-binding IclR family transcriptional regulator